MMRLDIVTIFPEFFAGPLEHGIVRRARESGVVDVRVQDLRAFAHDRHRTVDDRPFGGGEGMVLKPEPLFEAVESLLEQPARHFQNVEAKIEVAPGDAGPGAAARGAETGIAIVLLSASGKLFRQPVAERFAKLRRIVLLCGRYEGVDERVAEQLATVELSIGDFVLSGGELAAAIVVDAVTRLLPGALGNEASSQNESFSGMQSAELQREAAQSMRHDAAVPPCPPQGTAQGLLDCPHYTRPAEFRGWAVPEVLLRGNHEEIRRWRHEKALEKTIRNRPDLLAGVRPA